MPHRVVFSCLTCKDTHKRPIELRDIQVWIDEDRLLSFLGTCPACEMAFVIRASLEELSHRRNPKPFETPRYLM